MRSGKRQRKERTELPNLERIITFGEKEKLKVNVKIGSEHHRTSGEEREIRKYLIRRTRMFSETKPCSRNIPKGINTWVVSLAR